MNSLAVQLEPNVLCERPEAPFAISPQYGDAILADVRQ